MIVLANIDVYDVDSYHTESHLRDIPQKIQRITSTKGYRLLRSNIILDGVKDPILVMSNTKRRGMVEIGEQRLFIARELMIPTLVGIIYGDDIQLPFISRVTSLSSYNDCPAIRTLKKYIKAGIAKL